MSPAEVYEHLAGLLNPSGSSSSSRHRSSSDISDGFKRIRRLVLTEGIPEVVRVMCPCVATCRCSRSNPSPAGAWSGHGAVVLPKVPSECTARSDGFRGASARHAADSPLERKTIAQAEDMEAHAQSREPQYGGLPPIRIHGPQRR
jgi:hypothetical protein